jgi:predicted transcriptional regulator
MEGNKNADKSEQTSSFYPKNLDEVLELIGKEKHKSVELKEKKQAVLNEFASLNGQLKELAERICPSCESDDDDESDDDQESKEKVSIETREKSQLNENLNADKSEQTSSFYPKNLDEVLELIGKEKHKSLELKEKKQAILNEFASLNGQLKELAERICPSCESDDDDESDDDQESK